eukprot:TRINITY_DN1388_c1_g1_i1.p3 TRINITY_DN1388_c1_g1~~TRINITY_DN1388_c1_g1_i1.p3  ORF type:complete len:229 (+),score=-7.94 TRINITY_DN1388_c1_g1_i1:161-847(+)
MHCHSQFIKFIYSTTIISHQLHFFYISATINFHQVYYLFQLLSLYNERMQHALSIQLMSKFPDPNIPFPNQTQNQKTQHTTYKKVKITLTQNHKNVTSTTNLLKRGASNKMSQKQPRLQGAQELPACFKRGILHKKTQQNFKPTGANYVSCIKNYKNQFQHLFKQTQITICLKLNKLNEWGYQFDKQIFQQQIQVSNFRYQYRYPKYYKLFVVEANQETKESINSLVF